MDLLHKDITTDVFFASPQAGLSALPALSISPNLLSYFQFILCGLLINERIGRLASTTMIFVSSAWGSHERMRNPVFHAEYAFEICT